MKVINLAFVIDHLDVGGTESQLYYLLKGLDRQRFSAIVVCFKQKGRIAESIESLGFPVYRLPSFSRFLPKIFRRALQTLNLAYLFRQRNIHLVQNYLLTANIFGTLASWCARVPRVCASERNTINTDCSDQIFKNKVFKFLEPQIDMTIGNSDQVSQYLVERVQLTPHKVCTIPNGVPFAHFQDSLPYDLKKDLELPEGSFLLGKVARLVAAKNHSMLLQVVAKLRDRFPHLHLVLIGDGPLRQELEMQAQKLNLAQHIHFLGTRTDVPRLLASLDLVVSSSDHEGMPNGIMEAMAAGKAVVATNAGGTESLVVYGVTGFVTPRGNAKQLQEHLEILINLPWLCQRFGRQGQNHIKKEFSTERMVERTQKLYLELLDA